MPATLLRPHTFTVDEYHAMAEAGVLGEDSRVELIDGIITAMSPVGAAHIACVNRLNDLFTRLRFELEGAFVVSVQNPVRLGPKQEPEPDLALLRPFAEVRMPEAADALLVVEVADTTLATDRAVKAPRYAAAGVPEVWIVDLGGGQVEVYRQPGAVGYVEARIAEPGETLRFAAIPEAGEVAVSDVLGV
ncbi:MAG: Uma2 family endonuclease [Bacteroidota bacterium]